MTDSQTAAELDTLATRAQAEALGEVSKASLNLGSAEYVLRQAVAAMEDAIHAAEITGVPLAGIALHAERAPDLGELSRDQIALLIANAAHRAERALEAAEQAQRTPRARRNPAYRTPARGRQRGRQSRTEGTAGGAGTGSREDKTGSTSSQ